MINNYDDIINMEHHVSTKRPQMSMHDRAAQFSPFAALTGFGDAVNETGRLTDSEVFLDDNQYEILNRKILLLQNIGYKDINIKMVYFEPDKFKAGGSYEETEGTLKKIDNYNKTIVMSDGIVIPISRIVEIDSDIFKNIEFDDYAI